MEAITQIPAPPSRPDDAHKGTFGTVVVIGGCRTMIGAPAMTATAAFRAGAGLVKILTHRSILPAILTIEPSATGLDCSIDDPQELRAELAALSDQVILAAGPGMGTGDDQADVIRTVLQATRPTVLDADGLNNLATLEDAALLPGGPLVLTPHPGEFARLARAAAIPFDPTAPAERPDAAAALATHYRAVVVLKGRNTVVTDAQKVFVNQTGNPALATAGSGDILTGLIAGLMAQEMTPFDAAVLGVHLHGLAADLWAQKHGPAGLLARELACLIPDAMNALRSRP